MNRELPELLRRAQVMEFLGVNKKQIRKMIDCGVLNPIYWEKNSNAWFRRDELLNITEDHELRGEK